MEAAPDLAVNFTIRLRTRKVLLNSASLTVSGNTFPSVSPKHMTGVHINLEPMSYAFVVIPEADHVDCPHKEPAPPGPPAPPAPSPGPAPVKPMPGPAEKKPMGKKKKLILAACAAVVVLAVVVGVVKVKRRRSLAQRRVSAWMQDSLDKPLGAPLANSAQW